MMKRTRAFEENNLQNFQMQEEKQYSQVQPLKLNLTIQPAIFPSIVGLLSPYSQLSIIGSDPNAHLRAYAYFLLCEIRRQHYRKLISKQNEEQILKGSHKSKSYRGSMNEWQSAKKQRKVSFNENGLLFSGKQIQNYPLYRLRLFAFSSDIDLTLINNTPLQTNRQFWHHGAPLSSQQMKKLIAQFFTLLFPSRLPKNYHESLCSTQQLLNSSPIIPILMSILLRHILSCRYQIECAQDYKAFLHEHTICTALCDAFAIDGLLCKDQYYQINEVCRVHSVEGRDGRMVFVELMDDEIEEGGKLNEKKNKALQLIQQIRERERQILSSNEEASQEDVCQDNKHTQNLYKDRENQIHTSDFQEMNSSSLASGKESSHFYNHNKSHPHLQQHKFPILSYGARLITSIQVSESSASQSQEINMRDTFNFQSADFQARLLKQISSREEEFRAITGEKRDSEDSTAENFNLEKEKRFNEIKLEQRFNQTKLGQLKTLQKNKFVVFPEKNSYSDKILSHEQKIEKISSIPSPNEDKPHEFIQKQTSGKSREVKITKIGFKSAENSQIFPLVNNMKSENPYFSTQSSLQSSESGHGASYVLSRPPHKPQLGGKTIVTYGKGFARVQRLISQ